MSLPFLGSVLKVTQTGLEHSNFLYMESIEHVEMQVILMFRTSGTYINGFHSQNYT